jgi:hypothetical protein
MTTTARSTALRETAPSGIFGQKDPAGYRLQGRFGSEYRFVQLYEYGNGWSVFLSHTEHGGGDQYVVNGVSEEHARTVFERIVAGA